MILKKLWESGLDRIQFFRIRTGVGLTDFTVRSSLVPTSFYPRFPVCTTTHHVHEHMEYDQLEQHRSVATGGMLLTRG